MIHALSNFSDVHMKKKLLIFAFLEIMPNQKRKFDEIQRAANKLKLYQAEINIPY